MMSADNPAELDAALQPGDSSPVLIAANSQPIGSTAATSASEAPWPTFRSTEEFDTWLAEAAVASWGHLFGRPAYYHDWFWGGGFVLFQTAAAGDTLTNTDNDFSSTNLQVAGVDEADLVETDGKFLYIISGQQLVIVEAGVGDALRVVSRVAIDGQPVGMYLSGDRLAIVSSSAAESPLNTWNGFRLLADIDQSGYYESDPPTTTVIVLDVSDRTGPTLVQKTDLDGRLVTSRAVDEQLRLVLSNEIHLPKPLVKPLEANTENQPSRPLTPPALTIDPVINPNSDEAFPRIVPTTDAMMTIDYGPSGVSGTYETQEEYLSRIRDQILESLNPQIRSLALDGGVISETPLFEATDLNRPESLFDRHLTTVVTFDLTTNTPGPVAKASVLSGSPQVYSTAESVYVFAERSNVWRPNTSDWDGSPKSTIWKLDINAQTHAVKLGARGTIDGTLLNQFAADEHDGYLRVVTKSAPFGPTDQSLFVLEQVGRRLEVVGSLTGIAPTENLYSVRFDGERAFLVTFRIVDPLFSVDLSDPQDPKLLGELHIPGYSDYLQPLGENHILAIGRAASETTGLFNELQVSIFDVTELTNPQLLHRYSFGGGRSTATPATGDRWVIGDGDHHSVSFFPSHQLFALPIFSADRMSGGMGDPLFEVGDGGLQVFRIDVDAGIVPVGLIEHEARIDRSLRIGDHLYAISSGAVSVHEMTNPTTELGRIKIVAESDEQLVKLTMYPAAAELLSPTPTEPLSRAVDEAISQLPDPAVRSWRPSLESPKLFSPSRASAPVKLAAPIQLDADLDPLLAIARATAQNRWKESSADCLMGDDRLDDDRMDVFIEVLPQLIASGLSTRLL